MKTIRSLNPVFLMSAAIVALIITFTHSDAREAPATKTTAQQKSIAELQQERLGVLEQLVEVALKAYTVGEGDIEQGLQAQQQLLEAKLELAENRETRLEIHAKAVKLATEWQQVAEARYRAAQSSQADVLQCRANSLKAEIALQREQQERE